MKKPYKQSLPQRIRNVRKALAYWQEAKRHPANPATFLTVCDRELARLNAALALLEAQQADQMAAVEQARKEGRL